MRIKSLLKRRRKGDVQCFKRIQLIISGCLTMIVGMFTIIYTIQQSQLAEDNYQKEMIAAQILHEQIIYEEYVNDMLEKVFYLVKTNENESENLHEYKQHIRIKTIDALAQINSNQKKRILFFLYDNKLIRSDYSIYLLDLTSADFSNIQFLNEKNCDLRNLSLRNIIANSIEFINCNLEFSDFSYSTLVGATFRNTKLGKTKFFYTNLTNAKFIQSNQAGLWLNNSILIASQFDKPPQNMKFYNTDLFANSWTNEQIVNNTFNQEWNTVWNTRFSDGTFSQIDSKELVFDGGAEIGCEKAVGNQLLSESQSNWYQSSTYGKVYLTNSSKENISAYEGHCYFKSFFNNSEIEQLINLKNYSLFIDSQLAFLNFSYFYYCPFRMGQSYYDIGFYSDQLTTTRRDIREKLLNQTNHFQQINRQDSIPINTRFIDIGFGSPLDKEHQTDYCLFDNIHLNIFRK